MLSGQNTSFTDIKDIIHFLLRRWKLISFVIVVGVCMVMANVLMQPPLYTATTEIVLDPHNKNLIGNDRNYRAVSMDAAAIGSQIRIIKSTTIAKRVIEEMRLGEDEEFTTEKKMMLIGPFRAYLYKLLGFSVHEKKTIKNSTLPLVKRFLKRLKVDRFGKTYVIAISFTSEDSVKAARIANRVADAYIVNQFESRFALKKQVGKWLGERVSALLSKKQASERAVQIYMGKHNLIQVNGKAPYEAELEALSEKLIVARGELSEKHALYQQIQDVVSGNGQLSSVGALSKSDEIRKLRHVRARLAQEEAELTTLYTKRHPKVISKLKERYDLEKQMEIEARKIAGNIREQFIAARKKVAIIQKELEDLQKRTQNQRSALMHAEELKREAEADRTIYESFLTRYKNISQQETLRTAEAEIITSALPSQIPSAPDKKRALFLAFFGFTALGIGIAYLVEALNNKIKTPEDLKKINGVNYLTAVPELKSADLSHEGQEMPVERYAIMKPLTPYAEAMRSLRVSLDLKAPNTAPQKAGKIILFTSAQENAGKSSICSNFSQQCTSAGITTLLLDTDLRNPSLSRRMGCSQSEALVDILLGTVHKNTAIFQDHSGLDIISGDRAFLNSTELLSSEAMKHLLSDLRQEYDLIILDSSPLVPVVDAKVLAEYADQIVLVAEWNRTPIKAIEHTLDLLGESRDKLAGVLLNKVDFKKMQSYGAFDYGKYYSETYYKA